MDTKALKLELIERLAAIEDDGLLQAVKRLLDAPRAYGIPNEHLSIVKEGEEAYLPALRYRLHGLVDAIEDRKDLEHLNELLSRLNAGGAIGSWSDLSEAQRQQVLKAYEASLDPTGLRASEEVLKARRP